MSQQQIKTPIATAIEQIREWKVKNRLTDEDFEKAGFNEIIAILERQFPQEAEMAYYCYQKGRIFASATPINPDYNPDVFFNKLYTQS